MEEILCSVSPIKLIRLTGSAKSGCGVIDVTFPAAAGVKVSEICFKNNYTASISIKGKLAGPDDKFVTLVKHFQLMKSPHYANDSQTNCNINLAEDGIPDRPLVALRLILRQPSSIWQKFSVEDIKVYKRLLKDEADDVEAGQINQCAGSFGNIVARLQELVQYMEKMEEQQLEFYPAPFDVDGVYDINLLSYT